MFLVVMVESVVVFVMGGSIVNECFSDGGADGGWI